MRVRILGPFQFEEGGRRITVGGVRQCAALASLLLHAKVWVPKLGHGFDLGIYAAGSYSLMRPPRIGRRLIRRRDRSATG